MGKSQYSWGDWAIRTAEGGGVVTSECASVIRMEEIETENK